MATPVELPKSGNTVEECLIGRWVKREGDMVAAGDVLAEVETDKATFEIIAPVGGKMLATFFDAGALVPVFTTVCVIGAAGEDIEAFRPHPDGIRDSGVVIRKELERIPSRDPRTPNPDSRIPAPSALSPRARRFAAERTFSLPPSIVGSGPGGRVLEQDVRQAYDAAQRPAPFARPSGARAIIARRLRESLASTAQYTLHASAGAAGLLSLRAQIKKASGTGRVPDITVNALVTFCTIRALLETPDLNSELIDGTIVKHQAVHMGFACDTPRGLLVPVVRDAHALSIGELARRMNDLAGQAVDGSISPDHLSGATFTISNLGGLGVEAFTPVINVPQVAILGLGAIQVKPVRTGGRLEFVDSIGLSLTCDHQVIDGAPGARFLRTLKEKIENVEYDLILRS
jgi:pyruvate dehydrogenase E2 component (dihydrolipoamide acetyltransferase)